MFQSKRFPPPFWVIAVALLGGAAQAVPGDLDATFNSTGKLTTAIGGTLAGGGSDNAAAVAVQSDGKIVVAGSTNDNGTRLIAIARYLPDGSLDTSFGGTGVVKTDLGGTSSFANAVALQSDGKIVVAGSADGDFALARFTSAGALDTTFGGTGIVSTTDFGFPTSSGNGAYGVAVQSDGKIVAAGRYGDSSGKSWFAVARYNAEGSLDTTFNGTGTTVYRYGTGSSFARSVALRSDGEIIVAGYGWDGVAGHKNDVIVVFFGPDGTLDFARATDLKGEDRAFSVAVQTNDYILVAGETDVGGTKDFALLRFSRSGSLDTTLGGTGKVITTVGTGDDSAACVKVQPDGRILVGGSAIVSGANDFALVRYTSSGALDAGFGASGKVLTSFGGDDTAAALALQSDGKILLAGAAVVTDGDFAVARYKGDLPVAITTAATGITSSGATLNGTVEAGFATASVSFQFGPTASYGYNIAAAPSTVSVGAATAVSANVSGLPFGTHHFRVKAVNSAGTSYGEDRTFTIADNNAWLANLAPDQGALTPAFTPTTLAYVLVLPAAAQSVSFTPTAQGMGATISVDGEIVPSGQRSSPISLVNGFNSIPVNVTAQDGVTGKAYTITVLRGETGPGGPDGFFGTLGIVMTEFPGRSAEAFAVAIQNDGKIVAAGFVRTGSDSDLLVCRYHADGTPDYSFNHDGYAQADFGGSSDVAHGVAIQSDGKIVVAGEATVSGSSQFVALRFLPDGSPDPDFSGVGYVLTDIGSGDDRAMSVALQPDGKIVVAGSSEDAAASLDFATVRYNSDGALDTSFNGTGKVTTDFGPSGSADYAAHVLVQPDGKIVATGTSGLHAALARYNADGTLDTSFNTTGKATTSIGSFSYGTSAVLQSDGKILAAGFAYIDGGYDFAIARYDGTGSLDTSFGGTGKVITDFTGRHDYAASIALHHDGRIIVGGWSKNTTDYAADFAIARYNPDGSLDETFSFGSNPPGKVITPVSANFSDAANAIAIQPDGKMVAAGYVQDDASASHIALVRYHGFANLDAWRLRWFGSTSGAGSAAFNIDFDNDGLPNLLEYAFDLNPVQGASSQLPQAQRIGDSLVFDFTQPFGVSGITYGAEWSATMAPQDWQPLSDLGANGHHVFAVPASSGERLFLRLKVTSD